MLFYIIKEYFYIFLKGIEWIGMMNHKKKLVIVTDNFLPRRDGVVRFLIEVIPRLKSQFHITVICPDNKERVSLAGIKFIRIPLSKKVFGDFQFAKFRPSKMVRAIRKSDIVFSQTIGPIGGTGLFLGQTFKKKTVSFIHSIEWELFTKAIAHKTLKRHVGPVTKRMVRFLYNRCNKLIVPSEQVSELLLSQRINVARSVIHLGVDPNKFKPLDDFDIKRKERERLGIQMDDFVIGYHGRLSREKDIFTLLRAFIHLKKTNPRFKLLIVGSGLPDIVEKLARREGVIHIPATQYVERYLPLMDVYVTPSLTETTSLSTLEAMSCELPVVSTPAGYIRDYLKEGVNGLFFPMKNSIVLAKKILYLAKRKSQRDILGKQARATVVEKFNWDVTASKLDDFFKELTSEDL